MHNGTLFSYKRKNVICRKMNRSEDCSAKDMSDSERQMLHVFPRSAYTWAPAMKVIRGCCVQETADGRGEQVRAEGREGTGHEWVCVHAVLKPPTVCASFPTLEKEMTMTRSHNCFWKHAVCLTQCVKPAVTLIFDRYWRGTFVGHWCNWFSLLF